MARYPLIAYLKKNPDLLKTKQGVRLFFKEHPEAEEFFFGFLALPNSKKYFTTVEVRKRLGKSLESNSSYFDGLRREFFNANLLEEGNTTVLVPSRSVSGIAQKSFEKKQKGFRINLKRLFQLTFVGLGEKEFHFYEQLLLGSIYGNAYNKKSLELFKQKQKEMLKTISLGEFYEEVDKATQPEIKSFSELEEAVEDFTEEVEDFFTILLLNWALNHSPPRTVPEKTIDEAIKEDSTYFNFPIFQLVSKARLLLQNDLVQNREKSVMYEWYKLQKPPKANMLHWKLDILRQLNGEKQLIRQVAEKELSLADFGKLVFNR